MMDFSTPCTALLPRWDEYDAPPLIFSNEPSFESFVIRGVVVEDSSSRRRMPLAWTTPTSPTHPALPPPHDAASLARIDRRRNVIPDDEDRTSSGMISSFDRLPRRDFPWSADLFDCNARDDDAFDNMNGASLASDPPTRSSKHATRR
jgi:hypothetical protein